MFETYKQNILSFYRSNKRMPSYAEIMEITGLRSKSPVWKLVNKLVDEGYIGKDNQGKLIPKNMLGITKLSQTVSAGYGAYVEEEEEETETINLDEWLIGGKRAPYMLEVSGDSMKDASILDGDSVLVEKTQSFCDGQIVVALLQEGFTIKYLKMNGERMHLVPANKKYKPIYSTEENPIKLVGVVKTVIRNLV